MSESVEEFEQELRIWTQTFDSQMAGAGKEIAVIKHRLDLLENELSHRYAMALMATSMRSRWLVRWIFPKTIQYLEQLAGKHVKKEEEVTNE